MLINNLLFLLFPRKGTFGSYSFSWKTSTFPSLTLVWQRTRKMETSTVIPCPPTIFCQIFHRWVETHFRSSPLEREIPSSMENRADERRCQTCPYEYLFVKKQEHRMQRNTTLQHLKIVFRCTSVLGCYQVTIWLYWINTWLWLRILYPLKYHCN